MLHAVIQPMMTGAATAPGALRKRKATDVQNSLMSTRLRDSLSANMGPCSPDDNGKSRAKSINDPSSPGVSKRRRSSGSGSVENENSAPSVDASQQGSVGYVSLVTSIYANIVDFFSTSFFAPAAESEVVVAPPPARQATRTVVETKTFVLTPDNLINETPARLVALYSSRCGVFASCVVRRLSDRA
jgi:hypothetical protein